MGIGLVDPDATHRATLVAAAMLGLSGLAALSLVDSGTRGETPRIVAPNQARSPAPTYVDLIEGTTTTSWRNRTRPTWVLGDHMEVPRGYEDPAAAPPPSEPDEPQPATQFDVAVRPAGAQVSAGEGEGSCTTVQMTALTPEGCPPPSGDGPVVVRHPEPDVDNLPRQDTALV